MSLRKRLGIICIIGLVMIVGTILVALHHGFNLGSSYIVLPASGDSMLPWSHDGDTLIVVRNKPVIAGGRYVIKDTELRCKEFVRNDGATLHFTSLNEEGGSSFDVERTAVVGKVVLVLPTHYLWQNEGDPNRTPKEYRPATTEQKQYHAEQALAAAHVAQDDINKMEAVADEAIIDLHSTPGKKYLWGTTVPDKVAVWFPKGEVIGVTVEYEGARAGQIRIGGQTLELPSVPRNTPPRTIHCSPATTDKIIVEAVGRPERMGFFVTKLIIWVEK